MEPGDRPICRHFVSCTCELDGGPTLMGSCPAVLIWATKIPISGDFFSAKAL
jgi:hypothetical protein